MKVNEVKVGKMRPSLTDRWISPHYTCNLGLPRLLIFKQCCVIHDISKIKLLKIQNDFMSSSGRRLIVITRRQGVRVEKSAQEAFPGQVHQSP